MRVGLDGHGEGAAKAEVSDLEKARGGVDEEVLGLEVAVHDAVLVHVGLAAQELEHEGLQRGAVRVTHVRVVRRRSAQVPD